MSSPAMSGVVERGPALVINYSHIHVAGRRWFDRVNGNTYHSAVVYLTGETVDDVTVPVRYQYGYDDGYLESARAELVDRRLLPDLVYATTGKAYSTGGVRLDLRRICEYVGVGLSRDVADVRLKRDAVAFGGKS